MPRSPFALAALATAAIPGLEVVGATGMDSSNDFDVARIVDVDGRGWVIRAPRSVIAGASMEGEVALLEGLTRVARDGDLAFDVPQPQGFATLPEGGRAMVFPEIAGRPLAAEHLGTMAAEVARAVGALHSLPTSIVSDTGLPSYSAQEQRERRLAEIDEAAATGHVARPLLQRWEDACEDIRLWRFIPAVIHGDLLPEHILTSQGRVVGIIEWANARVGDPADDLAPLLAAAPEDAMDPLLDTYREARGVEDEHLLARAVLASELAILRWLMHGVRTDQDDVVQDAVGMLDELAASTVDAEPISEIGVTPPDVQPEAAPFSFAAPGSGAVPLGDEAPPQVRLASEEYSGDESPTIELPREVLDEALDAPGETQEAQGEAQEVQDEARNEQ